MVNINNTSGQIITVPINTHLNNNISGTGEFQINGVSITPTSNTYSGNTVLTTLNSFVRVSATATITLPTAVGFTGKCFHIKNVGTGIVTIDTTSSQTIDGELTMIIDNQYDSIFIVSNSTNWDII